ncbi:MAG: hypothetical protein GY903_31065 [Fuerstiella sp.]|nr:hypothetical protein [Fuerstiella sp.]MCP4858933.1 hypothetical protein [Fuerstiella sp.]
MSPHVRSMIRLTVRRLLSVSVCVFTFLPLPQLALPTWVAESTESECPCQEDEESSEERLAVATSERRLHAGGGRRGLNRPRETGGGLPRSNYLTDCSPAVVGHQLANGLRAPVRI